MVTASKTASLARAARTGTAGIATPTLTAHFHMMEARALARLGDARGCDRALAEAVREFDRRRPEEDPAWIRYFDEAELAAEFGHCLRDLGRAADAAQYASRGAGTAGGAGFVRSDFFATMVLADAHLAAGDLEQGCATALTALRAGDLIRSARCVNYLREFRQHLARAADAHRRIGDHLLPMRHPSHRARDREHHREHRARNADGAVDHPGVEVDVRVQLAVDEVLVLERDLL